VDPASLALWPDILGYGNSSLMGCYAVLIREWLPTFSLITLPSSSGPRSRLLEPSDEGVTVHLNVDLSCTPKRLGVTSQKTASLTARLSGR
jgi:hypothetical protein